MASVYCPYCHASDPTPLNVETISYSGIELTLLRNGSNALRARSFSNDEGSTFDHQEVVLINFCPMCGRPLHHRRYD